MYVKRNKIMNREKNFKKYLLTSNGYIVFAVFLLFGFIFMMAGGPVAI